MVEGAEPLLRFDEGHEDLVDNFDRTIDDKGRIVLPSGPQRDAFAGRAWLTTYKGCLAVWTQRSFRAVLADIERQVIAQTLPEHSVEAVRGAAVMVTIDSQGRFPLPAKLRDPVGIGGHGARVAVVGQGDRLEIRPIDRPDPNLPDVGTVFDMFKHI